MKLGRNLSAFRSISQFPIIRELLLYAFRTVPLTWQQSYSRHCSRNSVHHNLSYQGAVRGHLTNQLRHIYQHEHVRTHTNSSPPVSLRCIGIPTPTNLPVTRSFRRTSLIIHQTYVKARSKTSTVSHIVHTIEAQQGHQRSNLNAILTEQLTSVHVQHFQHTVQPIHNGSNNVPTR